MPIDYSSSDRVLQLSFGKFNRSSRLDFPAPGTLARELSSLLEDPNPTLPQDRWRILASAGVEMWHRAIHSFLWSVALTETSPLWASVSGYYASHFVMRAFAHSLGLFKSFAKRRAIQVMVGGGQFFVSDAQMQLGEHVFYWRAIKGHPTFATNPLFRENNERDPHSDSAHRTFANYTDHIDTFKPMKCLETTSIITNIEKISRIRLHSVTEASRDGYPDLQNVQILAFQRILAFNDFLDERIPSNRFWKAHRRPNWCRDIMLFQTEENVMEAPSVT
jgi:hypothetical protein